MIGKLKNKLESLMGTASGYKGIIFINFCILVLVLGLMFVQYNWISGEKKTIKTMIEKQKKEQKAERKSIQSTSKKLVKKNPKKRKQTDLSNSFSNQRRITKSNLENSIKNADMYFDYEQYGKAAAAYKRVTKSNIALDEGDRVLSRLAESYYKLKKYEKAIELYRKVSND